jgi:hypothetical protein
MKKTLILACLLSLGLFSSALVASPREDASKCGCGAGKPKPTGKPVSAAPAAPVQTQPAAVAKPTRSTPVPPKAPRPNREQHARPPR